MYFQSEYAISSFVLQVHEIKATSTVREQSKSCAGTKQKLCGNKATLTAKAVWEQGHINCKSCAGTRLHRLQKLCGSKAILTAKAVREQGYIDWKSCAGARPYWLQKLCGNKATLTAKAVREQGHIDCKSCAGARLHQLQKLCGNKGCIDSKSYAGLINRYSATIWCSL